MTPAKPFTATGVERLVVVPSPSWPLLLLPQANTLPSAWSARTCESPEAIAVIPVAPVTAIGREEFSDRPRPSSPDESSPQVRTAPSVPRATLLLPPAATAAVAACAFVAIAPSASRCVTRIARRQHLSMFLGIVLCVRIVFNALEPFERHCLHERAAAGKFAASSQLRVARGPRRASWA